MRRPGVYRKNSAVKVVCAHQLMTVVDEIAVAVLAIAQCFLGKFALSDIVGEYKLGASSRKIQLVGSDFHVDNRAVFFAVPALPGAIESNGCLWETIRRCLDILWRADLPDCHREKLLS